MFFNLQWDRNCSSITYLTCWLVITIKNSQDDIASWSLLHTERVLQWFPSSSTGWIRKRNVQVLEAADGGGTSMGEKHCIWLEETFVLMEIFIVMGGWKEKKLPGSMNKVVSGSGGLWHLVLKKSAYVGIKRRVCTTFSIEIVKPLCDCITVCFSNCMCTCQIQSLNHKIDGCMKCL